MLNGIDKYIQRITVCFLYPDITDLNNNKIDDFQELFLNLLLDFADAYAAWQRGSNENSNGLLREFFPKKTDLAKVTLDKLTEALMLINNRPRKCLGFKTPFDMFKHEIRKLI